MVTTHTQMTTNLSPNSSKPQILLTSSLPKVSIMNWAYSKVGSWASQQILSFGAPKWNPHSPTTQVKKKKNLEVVVDNFLLPPSSNTSPNLWFASPKSLRIHPAYSSSTALLGTSDALSSILDPAHHRDLSQRPTWFAEHSSGAPCSFQGKKNSSSILLAPKPYLT